MVCINFFMRMIDFDFNFVEYGFGSDEEFTRGRIGSENYSGTAIDFHAEVSTSREPIQDRKITIQDGIFRVLKVKVFHQGCLLMNLV